jgi:hypothetical protein
MKCHWILTICSFERNLPYLWEILFCHNCLFY